LSRDFDRVDKDVASPRNIDNESIAISSVVQRPTQRRHMDCKICRLDENIRPNASHQFFLGDKLTWAFNQNNKDFQSTTSEGNRLVALQQEKSGG
jgi:hypothetical protein